MVTPAPAQGNSRPFSHVMLDMETLGARPGCAILSIGAVAFDPNSKTWGPRYYQVISRRSCQNAGLFEERGTLAWWNRQTAEARDVLRVAASSEAVPIRDALDQFSEYMSQFSGQRRVWGCGSDFDNAILAHVYAVTGKPLPWRYTNNRCYRTLKNLVPLVTIERQGTHHNALDDAVHQAAHTMEILGRLRSALVKEFA